MTALAVAPDTIVTISYVLFDEHGEAVDRATAGEPLVYCHGYAQIVPGLEKGVEGLRAGERRTFTVEAEDAFGERDDEGVFEVEKAGFPTNAKVEPGDEFVAHGPDGEPIAMRIVEVRDDGFLVDTNHPLAGQRVRFEVEVSEVRAATEEEITKAQAELEERVDADGCCDHDHDGPHDHAHDHDHDHALEAAGELVQLSKKTPN